MKRSALFLTQNIVLALVQFGYVILVSRIFTPKDFAYYMAELSFIALLSTIGSAGFTQIVFTEQSDDKGFVRLHLYKAFLSGAILMVLGVLTVFPWFIFWALSRDWLEMTVPLLVVAVTPLFNFCTSLIRANFNARVSIIIQLLSFIVGYSSSIYLCMQTANPLFLFAAQGLSQLIVISLYLILGRDDLGKATGMQPRVKINKSRLFVRRARQLAGVSYLSTNVLRWTVSVTLGPVTLGHLNRSEAITAGPIGLFQNAFTTTVSSKGDGGEKIYSQNSEYVFNVLRTYSIAVLSGAFFVSSWIGPLTLMVFGEQWQVAAKLSSTIVLAWAGYSVTSVTSFIHETRSEWREAFRIQFTVLAITVVSACFLLKYVNIYFSTTVFGVCSYVYALVVIISHSVRRPTKVPGPCLWENKTAWSLMLICVVALAALHTFGPSLFDASVVVSSIGLVCSGVLFLLGSKKI